MFGIGLGSLLNPTFLKIGGVLLIAFVAYTAIDGHFKSVERVYREKDATIVRLQEQVAGAIIDNNNLKLAISSLEGEKSTLQYSVDRVIFETKTILESDNDYQTKLSDFERVIADQVRNDRIMSVREGRKAELLLNYINANVECWIVNIDNRTDGRCVMGVWRMNDTLNSTGR